MIANMTPPKADVYKDLQQDAKAFYGHCEAVTRGALDTLRELDPPDPQDDGALIEYWCGRVAADAQFPVTSGARKERIRRWAEGRATLARHLNRAVTDAGMRSIMQVRDFYTDTGITALFPAYVEGRIQQAMLATGIASELTFAEETVTSMVVKALYASDAEADRSLLGIAEGAEAPIMTLTAEDSTIALRKYGGQIRYSYETAAEQSVDALGNFIAKIGRQIGIDETDLILHLAIAGDGTTMGAAETNSTDVDVTTSGTITFADLLNWYYNVNDSTNQNAYRLNLAVGGRTDLKLIADLAEFSDVEYISGQNVLRIPTPVAMTYYLWNGGKTDSSYVDRLVIGLDTRAAFVGYSYGGMVQESDRLIDRGMNRIVFTMRRGFRKFDANAVQALDCAAVL